MLLAKIPCLCIDPEGDEYNHANSTAYEKTTQDLVTDQPLTMTQKATRCTLLALTSAEKPGRSLEITIDSIVAQSGGWSEYIARKILDAVEQVIKMGGPVKAAMAEALKKSGDAAQKLTTFAKEHPELMCTLIALGVLAILVPVVITALGFTAEGVVEGELKSLRGYYTY
jgi:hypothetical protein